MNTLALLTGLAGLIVLLPVGIVLLAQPRIGTGIRVSLGVRHPALLKWHRWTGWMALGGLLLMGMFSPAYRPPPGPGPRAAKPDARHPVLGVRSRSLGKGLAQPSRSEAEERPGTVLGHGHRRPRRKLFLPYLRADGPALDTFNRNLGRQSVAHLPSSPTGTCCPGHFADLAGGVWPSELRIHAVKHKHIALFTRRSLCSQILRL